jgi:predicted porin
MFMKIRSKFLALATCMLIAAPAIRADDQSDLKAQLQALQQQTDALQKQIQALRQQIQKTAEPVQTAAEPAASQPASPEVSTAGPAPATAPLPHPDQPSIPGQGDRGGFGRKQGDSLTFYTPGGEAMGGEITAYGNFDLSFDVATKGLSKMVGPDGNPPVGNMGWLPDISTNISYIGVRGFQALGDLPFTFVYQLETLVSVSSTSGTAETNSSESNNVQGGLTSRNSYIGLSSSHLGAIKFGKTDAPYKNSTARMNPFSGMVGDYQVIMGNTGGDNRVEFGTRLDHSIWYESPHWGGFDLNLLYSPGQNRANNSDNIAAGESDCTGGNIPGSGGITPLTCSDGSFSDAVSASLSYTRGRLYAVAAYERHEKVNRSSDITGIYGSGNAYSQMLEAQDVADEDAAKVGVQYIFPTKTSISGIVESMHRYVPADLEFQNERTRMGTWFAISQPLTRRTSLHLGWAHAFRTPGDPGQHNDSLITPPGGVPGEDATAGAHANNQANLFTTAIKYKLTESLSLYSTWALTANGPAAHFDLGAGGHVTTDCHDAFDATGGLVGSNPHCWTGGQLMATSVGMAWRF